MSPIRCSPARATRSIRANSLGTGKEQNFQVIRDEAIKLVQSLTPQTRFGIVRWSGGAHPWKPELVPATEENKQAAIAHIQNEVDYKTARPQRGKPGGTRHDYALAEAFSLKPETIYMLTDGNATASAAGRRTEADPAAGDLQSGGGWTESAAEKGASPRHLLSERQRKIRRSGHAARTGESERRQVPESGSERAQKIAFAFM